MAFGSAACSNAPPSEEVSQESAAVGTSPDFLWWDPVSGALRTWKLSGSTVTGTLLLDAGCGPGCSNTWYAFATDDILRDKIWWFDRFGTGEVAAWEVSSTGHVGYDQPLTWTCAPPDCSSVWKPVGKVHLEPPPVCTILCPVVDGMLWQNLSTNQTGLWMLDIGDQDVTSGPILSTTCGPTEGCMPGVTTYPRLTADFDGDGNSDVLWWNEQTGTLTIWSLWNSSNPQVIGTRTLSSQLPGGNGWSIVGAADVNGDNHVDLLWRHMPDGMMVNWLLDGKGNVIGTPTLSQAYDSRVTWQPVGYVRF